MVSRERTWVLMQGRLFIVSFLFNVVTARLIVEIRCCTVCVAFNRLQMRLLLLQVLDVVLAFVLSFEVIRRVSWGDRWYLIGFDEVVKWCGHFRTPRLITHAGVNVKSAV